MGKLTINGPFSIAILVYQRVDIFGTGFPMAFPPLFGAVKIPKSWVSPVDAARHRNKIRTITLWSIFGSPHQKTQLLDVAGYYGYFPFTAKKLLSLLGWEWYPTYLSGSQSAMKWTTFGYLLTPNLWFQCVDTKNDPICCSLKSEMLTLPLWSMEETFFLINHFADNVPDHVGNFHLAILESSQKLPI